MRNNPARYIGLIYSRGQTLWTWLILVGAVLSFSVATAGAETWTGYRLGEVSFEAPADWSITRQQRGRSYLLASPTGEFELRAEWWVQDEPLLGFSDIVSHRRVTVSGKAATFVRSAADNLMTVKVLFDEKRKDNRQLLFSLAATGVAPKAVLPLFDDLLSRVQFGSSTPPSRQTQMKERRTEAPAAPQGKRIVIVRLPAIPPSDEQVELLAPDDEEVRLWLGPVSFTAPLAWQVRPDDAGEVTTLIASGDRATIVVALWAPDRPMPSEGVTRVESTVVAGEPAMVLRQQEGRVAITHVFFDEPLSGGVRLAVTLQPVDGPAEDWQPVFELLLASINRTQVAPGAPLLPMVMRRTADADPFADVDMDELLR